MAEARERWGTKLGVIMAVAGSAIGLGNFLRFPVQAAQNGGGAFMIPYIAALLLIGVPMMWVEWTAGRYGGGFGHSSAPGIFQCLWPKNPAAKYIGVLGLIGPLVIMMYYVYIESWTLAYSYYSLTGALTHAGQSGNLRSFLAGLQGLEHNAYFSGMGAAIVFFIITFTANMLVVYFGIKGGIERFCNIAMPVLLIFGILLAIRVLTLFAPDPSHPDWTSINGLGFLWNPDFSALKSPKVWLAAAGQIFFTLSLGMGVILTYASYVRKRDDIALSGLTAASTNEFAEIILGGSIIIPAAFVFFGPTAMVDIAHSGAFNLGFVTMPAIFSEIPLSWVFSFLWFFMLFLAGITSSISLSQPLIAFLEDEFKMERRKAVLLLAATVFILCQPGIWFLANGVVDDLDFWGGNFVIVLGATVEIILVAWVFGIDKTWSELEMGAKLRIPRLFKFVIKYITPVLLLAILGAWFFEDWIPVILMKNMPAENIPYVLGTRLTLLAVIIILCVMVRIAWQRRRRETGREV
ncbi:MAG: sodium-dependent transporter [candidate division Zixibacteria bacterium]|nr:sodium-dependent transporter [candidate division Zixibacteria bacterium]